MLRNNYKKRISVLILIFVMLLQYIPTYAIEETQTIKVGYTINYGTVKSSIGNGKSGYGYEYLTKIFEYAVGDYQLEFICCDWLDAVDMLENGDIDILGPITHSELGEEMYLYPDESFGDNVIMLSTLEQNDINYQEYGDIDNSVIAVQYNNPNEYRLYEFLEKYNLEAEIVYFEENDYETVMNENDYDFCLCSSLQTVDSLSPVAKLGTTDFYYVTALGNDELMDEMNYGMEQIEQKEFLYQEKLYLEYYDYSLLSSNYIETEDYEILQSQTMYHVGIENIDSPICYKDSNDEFQGIAIDALDSLAQIAGINYDVVEITEETSSAEIDSLDFAMLAFDNLESVEMIPSDAYYTLPLTLVERYYDEGHDFETIGVLEYYEFEELSLPAACKGREIKEYSSVLELLESYNDEEFDSFLLTSASINLFRDEIEDLNFISNSIDSDLELVLMFPEDYDVHKIGIFNKVIAHLDSDELDVSVLYHSTETKPTDFIDFLSDNPMVLNFMILGVAILIVSFEFVRRRSLRNVLDIDELTGLSSRHKFLVEARKTLNRQNDDQFMIITIDIDNFKHINEFFGYEIGSKVIQIIGKAIKNDAKEALLITRYEADKFALLLKVHDNMKELEFALSNSGKLNNQLRPLIGDTYHLSFSIGAYLVEDKSLDLNFMIDCANLARNLGKDYAFATINIFGKEMNENRIKVNEIVANMKQAIIDKEFILQYQPKVDMGTDELVGAEALVRWKKGSTMIPPNDFISVFEKNRFIETLDYYVLEEACIFINQNRNTPKISVNISGITIVKEDVVQNIQAILTKYTIPYIKIDIEITETAFLGDIGPVVKNVKELRELGITISIDDFGVGISSLSRLKDMPADTLKIDREFIIDCLENDKGRTIIKGVIDLAKELHLETVAEGIETKEQGLFLSQLGCDIGQGYYFSRPLPEQEFVKQINKDYNSIK